MGKIEIGENIWENCKIQENFGKKTQKDQNIGHIGGVGVLRVSVIHATMNNLYILY